MKNNNDNNIKANRKIKQVNKVKSFKKNKMKVRATVNITKKELIFNI